MNRLLLALLLCPVVLFGQISAPARVNVEDEGVAQGGARTLNCTGTGITCTVSGSIAALDVSGGGGGSGNFLDVTIDLVTHASLGPWQITRSVLTGFATPYRGIVWASGCYRFVGVGGLNDIAALSSDGRFWYTHAVPAATLSWVDVAYAPSLNRLVAVGSGSTVIRSDDCGGTWASSSATANVPWNAVTWSPSLSLFVAVAESGTDQVQTSSDGITWTPQTEAEANAWVDVAWSPALGLFAAVSTNGTNRAMTSANGSVWTARALSSASAWAAVTWSPELAVFVAVARETGANPRVATSDDGATWTTQTAPPGMWVGVAWAPEIRLFVATGTNEIMTSPDGVNWTETAPFFDSVGYVWNSPAWSPYLRAFVISADSGFNDTWIAAASAAIAPGFVYTVTITGQSWVTADSRILCNPFGSTTDGLTPETVFASGVQAIASNRVVGTGFDLSVYTPHGATGTYRFHCTGS